MPHLHCVFSADVPGSFSPHKLQLLLQFLRLMSVDEFPVHIFDAVQQSGLFSDLHQRFLQFVVVKILLLVLSKQRAKLPNVCLGDDIRLQPS